MVDRNNTFVIDGTKKDGRRTVMLSRRFLLILSLMIILSATRTEAAHFSGALQFDDGLSGDHATVAGGGGGEVDGNQAFGNYTAILGGVGNIAGDKNLVDRTIGMRATVSGGTLNVASGGGASVSGGYQNTASGHTSSVSGGHGNTASGTSSSVSGGSFNTASATKSSVSGGYSNTAGGVGATVSGGAINSAAGENASVSGGANITEPTVNGWSGGSYHTP